MEQTRSWDESCHCCDSWFLEGIKDLSKSNFPFKRNEEDVIVAPLFLWVSYRLSCPDYWDTQVLELVSTGVMCGQQQRTVKARFILKIIFCFCTRFCYITFYILKHERVFIYNLKLYLNAVTSATSKLMAQENFNISNNIFTKQQKATQIFETCKSILWYPFNQENE